MKNRSVILILVLAALLASALPALAAANTAAALAYLKTQQNADGGFGSGFSPDSTISSTADAVQAIVASGGDLAAFDQGGKTPLTYLSAQAPSAATSGDLAKLILAAIAAGENPRSIGGVDAVAKLEGLIRADGFIGGEQDTYVSHILAVLALASAQQPIPASSVGLIKIGQQDNGGWAWDGSAATAADTNTTAFAIQAFVASGRAAGTDLTDSNVVAKALAYFKSIQNEDGGWPYQNPSDYGTDTDANSTAVVIQAIIAAGQDPAGAKWTTAAGNTPVSALEGFQNDSGAFAWQLGTPDDNLLATVQALPALAGKAFPLATANVGAAPSAAAPAATPATMPQTGGEVLNLALPLILGGLALAGGSFALRRKK